MEKTNSSYPPFHPARADLPLALTAEEFKREFPEETLHIEFKSGISQDQIPDTVVAFSNADGGVILVGVTDTGEVAGRALDSGSADAIYESMRAVRDPGRYSLHELSVAGRPIIAISVARRQEGFAQTSKGVVKLRKGTSDEPIFGSELQRLVNERTPRRFELSPEPIPISSNPGLIQGFCAAFGWSTENQAERLSEHGYAINGQLTVAGSLFLTEDPANTLGKAYTEILRYSDDGSVDYDLRLEIRGPLPSQLERSVDRILDELGTELVVLGIRRYDLSRLPPNVIREAMANALAHRDYELDRTPVKVEIRPSFVVIRSPGGLPEPVTIENIRETTAPRNLGVIRALRQFGLAEDAGMGIDVMEDTMHEEMLDPPEFLDHGHEVAVVLPIRSAVAPAERAWIRELERRGSLTGPDRLLLVHAARGEQLTNATAREILQADRPEARAALQRLRDSGFLEQRGNRGGATYHLAGNLEPPAGLLLNAEELADLVEGLAAEKPISNANVRDATGLDRWRVRDLLGTLVDEERLVKVGERRGTRYRLRDP